MTESEWLQYRDIPTLLDYLVDRASSRKFRLFGAACCRRIWPLLTDPRARNTARLAGDYADNLAPEEYVELARRAMTELCNETGAGLTRSAVDSLGLRSGPDVAVRDAFLGTGRSQQMDFRCRIRSGRSGVEGRGK